jgi:hypothetical protein
MGHGASGFDRTWGARRAVDVRRDARQSTRAAGAGALGPGRDWVTPIVRSGRLLLFTDQIKHPRHPPSPKHH